jgi:L-rhamnose isomerase
MKELTPDIVARNFSDAKTLYAQWGVDVEQALRTLASIPLSIHCWQGDDVRGYEAVDIVGGQGVQTTGSYPGRARTADELRADFQTAIGLIPGSHRLALHGIYAETGGKKVDRDRIGPEHFTRWMSWAKETGVKLDFNQSFFNHPLAESGFTLSSRDSKVRGFWVEHAIRCREIGEAMGREQGSPCVVNLWIQDGYKDTPADRLTPRLLLKESLDRVFAELDALEGKLFGIGTESYVVGSHEFYIGYALKNDLLITLDTGHYHPTETVTDKISSLLPFAKGLFLHVSRGIRWDSDHVVTLTDEVKALASEVARANAWDRVYVGTDFFDASINRIAAWVIGARSTLRAILIGLLEPAAEIRAAEEAGNLTARLALQEEAKNLPFGAVWDEYCSRARVPVGAAWLAKVAEHERAVLAKRR